MQVHVCLTFSRVRTRKEESQRYHTASVSASSTAFRSAWRSFRSQESGHVVRLSDVFCQCWRTKSIMSTSSCALLTSGPPATPALLAFEKATRPGSLRLNSTTSPALFSAFAIKLAPGRSSQDVSQHLQTKFHTLSESHSVESGGRRGRVPATTLSMIEELAPGKGCCPVST